MKIRELMVEMGFNIDASGLRKAEGSITSSVTKLAGAVAPINQITFALYALSRALGGVIGGFMYFVQAGMAQEKINTSFEVLMQSADAGKKKLAELYHLATTTPFEIGDVERNAAMLLAMGIAADNLVPTMRMLGTVTAALPNLNMERLALNYGQVMTQGWLTSRELRDFAVGGVPILAELAEMLGKTQSQIREMISRREISAKMVEDAFKRMTSEGGRFNGMLEKQAATLWGMYSNLHDSITLLARDIGSGIGEEIKEVVKDFTTFFKTNKKQISEVFTMLLKFVARFLKFWLFLSDAIKTLISVYLAPFGLTVKDVFIFLLKTIGTIIVLVSAFLVGKGLMLLFTKGAALLTALGSLQGVLSGLSLASFSASLAKAGGLAQVLSGNFLVVAALAAAIPLLIDDIWVTLKGGDSLINRFIESSQELEAGWQSILGILRLISGTVIAMVKAVELMLNSIWSLVKAIPATLGYVVKGVGWVLNKIAPNTPMAKAVPNSKAVDDMLGNYSTAFANTATAGTDYANFTKYLYNIDTLQKRQRNVSTYVVKTGEKIPEAMQNEQFKKTAVDTITKLLADVAIPQQGVTINQDNNIVIQVEQHRVKEVADVIKEHFGKLIQKDIEKVPKKTPPPVTNSTAGTASY